MSSGEGEREDATTRLRARPGGGKLVVRSYRLTVVEGPDTGLAMVVDGSQGSRILLGQSPVCQFRLTDREVSRRHAALDAGPEGLHLIDLGSTNGTLANGVRVKEAYVRGGETLALGATVLRVDAMADREIVESSELRFGRLVGGSPQMRRLHPLCERLAKADVPVILEGETGTGKEVLAESLHDASARASAPFVVFDCTATPPNLMESALFGHDRGAFTGAVAARRGVFEQADGGTLLIDEIGELELASQSKLLRAIERGEVQRVGAERWTPVNVRVLAATRRDLDREVQEGRFRDDLFFRLAVARIELPPLREREGDIGLLARHFWHDLGGDDALPVDLVPRLEAYAWPGNVRELRNAIARRLALGDAASIGAHRGAAPTSTVPNVGGDDIVNSVLALDLPITMARQRVVEAFEARYVSRILERYDGNVARAATASGLKRRYFQILKARQGK